MQTTQGVGRMTVIKYSELEDLLQQKITELAGIDDDYVLSLVHVFTAKMIGLIVRFEGTVIDVEREEIIAEIIVTLMPQQDALDIRFLLPIWVDEAAHAFVAPHQIEYILKISEVFDP